MGDYALPNDFPALTDNKAGTLTDVRLSDTTDPGVETPDATPIDDVVDYIPGRRDTETLHSKGKAVRQGTNDDDKKIRQKLQNRKAAERSRSNRKPEQ